MSKFFVFLLSLQLILAPVAVSTPAYAKEEDKYLTEGSGGVGIGSVVNQVTNIATTLIGANIMTECYQGLMMPSIATFMAGSLVNVIAEIAGAKHKNDRDRLKLKELKELEKKAKEEKDSTQVAAMEALLVAEKDNYNFMESRKKWTLATTVIYAAAMGLAIAEEVYGLASATTSATAACTSAGTAAATCGTGAAIPGLAAIVAPLAAAAVGFTASTGMVIGPAGGVAAAQAATSGAAAAAALSAATTTLLGTCTTLCNTYPVPAGCPAAIAAAVASVASICAAGTAWATAQEKAVAESPGISGARTMISSGCAPFSPYSMGCYAQGNTYLTAAWGACAEVSKTGNSAPMLMGMALLAAYGFGNKSNGPVATYGSMVAGLLQSLIPAIGKFIVILYSAAIPRSITFGASGVLTGIVTADLHLKSEQSLSNITALSNAIDRLKDSTQGAGSGIKAAGTMTTDDGNTNAVNHKNSDLKKLSTIKERECFSQSSSGFSHSAAGCRNPYKFKKANFGKFNTPALNKVGTLAGDLAQALINGDEASAAQLSGEIGSYAARVKAETEELKKIYNEGEKKANRPTKDFDKSIKAQVAAMQAQVYQAAKSSGVDLNKLATVSPDVPRDEKGEIVPDVTAASVASIPLPEVDPLAGLGTESTEVAPEADAAAAASPQNSLDDFESTVEDISKKSDVSIFKQLSNRYILNYTKFYEPKKKPEIEQEAPAQAPPVQN